MSAASRVGWDTAVPLMQADDRSEQGQACRKTASWIQAL
jgi:hypothetical protein